MNMHKNSPGLVRENILCDCWSKINDYNEYATLSKLGKAMIDIRTSYLFIVGG